MKITVISCWYNEEFLAPYFLKHYSFADRIIVLVDSATTDSCRDIASKCKNTEVMELKFNDGIDEKIKVFNINTVYKSIADGYVINADADEFVFCERNDFIGCEWEVSQVALVNVYRHAKDKDLSIDIPIKDQRRHGKPMWPYMKPIVARAGFNFEWIVGNHGIKYGGVRESYFGDKKKTKLKYRTPCFYGAHWANADPCFCVRRRLAMRDRQSALNLRKGYSLHNHSITEEMVIDECRQHANDPVAIT